MLTENMIRWIMLKNIVLIIATCLSVYFVSGWMIFMMLAYTSIEREGKKNE